MSKSRLLIASIIFFFSFNAYADVIFKKLNTKDKLNHQYASLKITGEITSLDVKPLKSALKTIKTEHLRLMNDSVELDSRGGTVYGSMAVGRVIRSAHLSTLVKKNAFCDSGCVYVLIAGVCRIAEGKVGVHQVYFDIFHSRKEAEDTHLKEKELLLSYLNQMDAPRAIYELGDGTPSYNIRELSEYEKEDFGLYTATAVEQDYRMSVAARTRNVSKKSLRKELDDKFVRMNANQPDGRGKLNHPSCSEQLFLNEAL
jgi:hypothetical protein